MGKPDRKKQWSEELKGKWGEKKSSKNGEGMNKK